VAEYRKRELPNYQVFDEKRYFSCRFRRLRGGYPGRRVGLSICEDIWVPEPAAAAAAAGAELLINLNASPYHRGKQDQRLQLVARRAREHAMPVVYVNQVGGQDELVFDGGSFAMMPIGQRRGAGSPLRDRAAGVRGRSRRRRLQRCACDCGCPMDELAATWQALVLGVRDYVNKNGFPGVVLGLSGGVDSA
jgi:NAD+ synthase (glutamine-hydrolysing)